MQRSLVQIRASAVRRAHPTRVRANILSLPFWGRDYDAVGADGWPL